MNDRDKTDVWSTSGVICLLFFVHLLLCIFFACYCLLLFLMEGTGRKTDGGGGSQLRPFLCPCLKRVAGVVCTINLQSTTNRTLIYLTVLNV